MYTAGRWWAAAKRPTLPHMSTEHAAGPARAGSGRPRLARPSVRDAAIAAAVTIVGVAATYGEAHPSTPGTYFTAAPPAAHAGRRAAARRRGGSGPGLAAALPAGGHRRRDRAGGRLHPARLRERRGAAAARRGAGHARRRDAHPLVGRLGGRGNRRADGRHRGRATRWASSAAASSSSPPTTRSRCSPGSRSPAGTPTWTPSASQSARRAAQEAQRRVDEERLRIARELHDVVAHTMATITVQAAAATQLLRDQPDEAAESLRAIRAASKDGLRELRAILDVLRSAPPAAARQADGAGRPDPACPRA